MEILDSVNRQKIAALNSKKFLELKKQRKARRDQFACMEITLQNSMPSQWYRVNECLLDEFKDIVQTTKEAVDKTLFE